DVDNDGHADIVVTSDNYGACQKSGRPEAATGTPWTGFTQGIFVLRDPMNRWLPSRALWNEHSYHITNINDDLTVPLAEQPNWLSWNNYRQNVQKGPAGTGSLPDPTGKVTPTFEGSDCGKLWRLHGQVCNRGGGPASPPIFATFYSGDPRNGGAVICTTQTTKPLDPGKCEQVTCNWNNPPSGPRDIWLRVGDDGMGHRISGECK